MNETVLNPIPPVGVYYGTAFCPPSLYDHALIEMLRDITGSDALVTVSVPLFSELVEKRLRVRMSGKYLRTGTCTIVSGLIADLLARFGVGATVVDGFIFHRHQDRDHGLYGYGHIHPHSWIELSADMGALIIDPTYDCVNPGCSHLKPDGAIFVGERPVTYLLDPVLVSRGIEPHLVELVVTETLSPGRVNYDA